MRLHRVTALLLKNYYITRNSLDRLFDVFYWPALDIFLWGFTALYLESITDKVIWAYLLGGVILWVFTWRASQDVAVYILEDFWSYNLYNLFSSPVRGSEIILSTVIFGIIRSFISFAFLLGLAYVLYAYNILSIGVMYLPAFIAILVLFGWVIGIVIAAFIFRYGQRIQVFAWSTAWIIQPFACVFYPLKSLPAWGQKIALLLPPTYVFETMRALINHQPVVWQNLAWGIAVCLILLVLAALFFSSSLKHARRSGLLTRYA